MDAQAQGPVYALWNVYVGADAGATIADDALTELSATIDTAAEDGVTLRGLYDVSGLRADADLMVWTHGDDPARLQKHARRFRRHLADLGARPVWNALGVHREAEFNRSHVPAFVRGVEPAAWVAVYPFNRSYEWYLLPEEERRALLAEHGRAGAAYSTVLTNTVSAFALGDYEWVLPLEADDAVDLVDLMRTLRATGARRHVREETPFFTGRRIDVADLRSIL